MFRFEYLTHFYALIGIPLLLVVFLIALRLRKRAIKKFGDQGLMQALMPDRSRYKDGVKFTLLMFCFTFLVIAWANPQFGTKREKAEQKSIDIILAVDVSTSMLAQDIVPSRMERTKQFCLDLIRTLSSDRIGIVVFAGSADLYMPVTNDYAAAQNFVKSISTDMISEQGTSLAAAIEKAKSAFEKDNKSHRALIVISDGENHEPQAIESAETAAEEGMIIFTVGAGTVKGAKIPTVVQGNLFFKRDEQNEIVISKLNEGLLKDIARAGKGAYFNLRRSDDVFEKLNEEVQKIEKRAVEMRVFNEFETYFQLAVLLAILLLIIDFFISYKKSEWLKRNDLF